MTPGLVSEVLALRLALVVCAFAASEAHAQIRVRVSVNFINNVAGNRPAGTHFSTNGSVVTVIDEANQIMAGESRGYRLELVRDGNGQVVIGDVPNFTSAAFVDNGTPPDPPPNPDGNAFQISPSGANTAAIETHARQAGSNYNFRTDAINVYVVQGSIGFTGWCSFPGENRSTILVAASLDLDPAQLLLHEIGHFFNLAHTFDSCVCCDRAADPMCQHTFGDDGGVADTLPDFDCDGVSASLRQIVAHAHSIGLLSSPIFATLTPAEKVRVNQSVDNLMSYRDNLRITEDQMDIWTTTANLARRAHVTGDTTFVSVSGFDLNSGLRASEPVRTVAEAHNRVSNADEVLLVRAGNYQESISLFRPCTLRATRGPVRIGP